MVTNETTYFDQKINEFCVIAKELNFLKPNGEADTEACLKFLIEFDELQKSFSCNKHVGQTFYQHGRNHDHDQKEVEKSQQSVSSLAGSPFSNNGVE